MDFYGKLRLSLFFSLFLRVHVVERRRAQRDRVGRFNRIEQAVRRSRTICLLPLNGPIETLLATSDATFPHPAQTS